MKPATKKPELSGRAAAAEREALLMISPERREAFWAGAPIDLPELSFQFLASLASRGAQPTTYDDLANEVWSGLSVTQDTIKQRARLVREALAAVGADKDVIQTVRGVGYRLVLPEQVEAPAAPKRGYMLAGAGVFLLLVLVAAFALLRPSSASPEPAIAVMPLSVIGAEDKAELAQTIEAEMLSSLGQLKDVRLIAMQTMTALSGVRAKEIYDETNAAILVEGSIRAEGEDTIIDMRGIDTKSEIVIWSYRYVTGPSAPSGVEGRIAQHATRYLHDGALMTKLADAKVGGSKNEIARTEFLNALAPFYAGYQDDLNSARALLLSAVGRDENFAAAHARLAEVYARLALRFDDESAVAPALKHAEQALAQTPQSALAHYSYALALYADGNKERALEELTIVADKLPFAERDLAAIQNSSK